MPACRHLLWLFLPSLSPAWSSFEEGSASLEARNVYLNRDFREGVGQSRREEWGQGLVLRLASGHTEGSIGFGLDAVAMLGLKLDSSPARSGSGMLPVGSDGRSRDEFSWASFTGKMQASRSQLRIGHLEPPSSPALRPNDGRILPQTYEGAWFELRELDGLELDAGRLTRVHQRNASGAQDPALANPYRRFPRVEAPHYDMLGLFWRPDPGHWLGYQLARLDEVYLQHHIAGAFSQVLGRGQLRGELRLSQAEETGAARAGELDNRTVHGFLAYGLGPHRLLLARQQVGGANGFPYLLGADPALLNLSQINDFGNAGERSWQWRYDHDFTALGLPGFSALIRRVSSEGARIPGLAGTHHARERDIEFRYQPRQGPLKDLSVRLRFAHLRGDYVRDTDEVRLQIGYTRAIW
ncbi:OprD family outer membrane porin [Metapseudomonas resinovorans]|uniref:Putative tricarboxylate-specific porin OpdH n=1 Tax=Metapseudomonas resinovorans NBRC 106553 TaxID=1245471 RepID=S6ATV9_METRE|nr:OprD family outer membrane porin [Pseudomonas resinovorans]BAN49538.1 putative tricarboxylate-specific porin OpdH [Pseudomonas resinovorans NBRC 106553]